MYNPPTRCQVMSYLDYGSPEIFLTNRQSYLDALNVIFTQGYNTRSVSSIIVTNENNKTRVFLRYDSAHRYSVGKLLSIENSPIATYNGLWRILKIESEDTLELKLIDKTLTYTSAENITGMTTKIAPLDWEICYQSSQQFSIRSKRTDSSRNVLTYKYPSHKALRAATNSIVWEMRISSDIRADGVLIEDQFNRTDYTNIPANDNLPFGRFYTVQFSNTVNISSPITPSNTARAPWYIIGDGRIFYFIVGGKDISTNPIEATSTILNYNGDYANAYRDCYVFGDPNCVNTSDVLNKTGTIFSFYESSSALNQQRNGLPFYTYTRSTVPLYFLKGYDGVGNSEQNQACIASSIGGITTNSAWGAGFGSGSTYPTLTNPKLLVFPVYLYSEFSTSLNTVLRAKAPYVGYIVQYLYNAGYTYSQLNNMFFESEDESLNYMVVTTTNNAYMMPLIFNLGV